MYRAHFAWPTLHRAPNFSYSYPIIPNITNLSVTQPVGELLPGLLPLLTTHHMNAEENTRGKQPYGLKQTYGEFQTTLRG